MNRKVMAVMICLAVVVMTGSALAQQQGPVAGMSIGVAADELVTVAKGWSAKKQIMGKDVYNDKNEKVGMVEDLIITPDKAVSYAIIGTGGFLGMEKHEVAIPVNQFKMVEDKVTCPGATKEAVKAMPTFQYPKYEGRSAAAGQRSKGEEMKKHLVAPSGWIFGVSGIGFLDR